MDSKLVVEQMSGRWQIKHPDMKQLALQAQRIARQLGPVRYTWVPRAQNGAADALANSAMDGKPVHRDPAAEAVVLEDDVQPTAEPAPRRHDGHPPAAARADRAHPGASVQRPQRPAAVADRAGRGRGGRRARRPTSASRWSSPRRCGARGRPPRSSPAALGLPVELDEDLRRARLRRPRGADLRRGRAEAPAGRPPVHEPTSAWPRRAGSRSPTSPRGWPGPGGGSSSEHAGKTVLVVSHVTPIKLFLAAGLGRGRRGGAPGVPGGGVAVHGHLVVGRPDVGAPGQRHRPPALELPRSASRGGTSMIAAADLQAAQSATVAADVSGTVARPTAVCCADDGRLPAEHPPPQQVGQRPDVGQVRADVDADQHREHRPGAADGEHRQQRERRRQVVQQVGQHRGDRGDGQQGDAASRRPGARCAGTSRPRCCRTASTTTASASTNSANGRSAACTRSATRVVPADQLPDRQHEHPERRPARRGRPRPARRPRTRRRRAPRRRPRPPARGGTVVTGSPAGFASSARNSHRRTANSTATATSHGASISPVKCRNDSPVAAKASRLVRFDTGRSSDAEFARWPAA